MHIREYFEEHQDLTNHLGRDDWRFCILGACTELGEIMKELPWRPWRVADHREPTAEEIAKALDEACDAIGAITRAFTHLDVSPEQFEKAMLKHLNVKWSRIASNIDGLKE